MDDREEIMELEKEKATLERRLMDTEDALETTRQRLQTQKEASAYKDGYAEGMKFVLSHFDELKVRA